MIMRRSALGLLAVAAIPARGSSGQPAAADTTLAAPVTIPGELIISSGGSAAQEISFIPPTGNPATDTSAINDALASGNAVQLLPGDYVLSAPLQVGGLLPMTNGRSGAMLAGCGTATRLIPNSPIGTMVTLQTGALVRDLQFYGGSGNWSVNHACHAMTVAPGASQITVDGVSASYVNGWVLNGQGITGAVHLSVIGLRGNNNKGGVVLDGTRTDATGNTVGTTAQVGLTDIDLQQCEAYEALRLVNVYDVGVQWLNCSVGSAGQTPAFSTVHLLGDVATALFSNVDAGVFTDPATMAQADPNQKVLHITSVEGTTTYPLSPSDISFSGCTFQQGGIGVQLDSGDQIRFSGAVAKSNLGDGWQLGGGGLFISLTGCSGRFNNQGTSGTGCDVNVTGSARTGLFGFGYLSRAAKYSLKVSPANMVTNDNPTYDPLNKGPATNGLPLNPWT
jgi:hypothetical protein